MSDLTKTEVQLLSSQGRAVLQALAAAPDGLLATADVLQRVRRPGASSAVTRASVSRTLRRLWTAGVVELADGARRTLTAEAARLEHFCAAAQREPEAAYRAYLNRRRVDGQPDAYRSASRYAAAWRQAAQQMPHLRVRAVQLTASGRQAVNSARADHV